jgi:uncharacterized hydrophobic protein (TIGR00271 family)
MRYLVTRVINQLNLEKEIDDFELIHQSIEKDIALKGTNLWILVFAILIASVGLNMNSAAVIIGAMLISPLMGPITGMGYSIATYDFMLFRQSFKSFLFAVLASLLASTLYFSISPISTAHSELLARTSPTIYDVLIAFFGGLAGIVAISSKRKGNVIPGVAIATALMPPLCTAGYGLATRQFNYFFGAFYLFIINSVFIALASLVVSQILKFPIRSVVGENHKKRINHWITVIILIIVIPSLYFGYQLNQEEKFQLSADAYLKSINVVEGNFLLKNDVNPKKKSIVLVYGGPSLSETQKEMIKNKAGEFNLDKESIEFNQGISFDNIVENNSEVENLKLELRRLKVVHQESRKRDSLNNPGYRGRQLLNEIRSFYPQVSSCLFSSGQLSKDSTQSKADVVVFTTGKIILTSKDRKMIEKWLKTRLNADNLKIYFDNMNEN